MMDYNEIIPKIRTIHLPRYDYESFYIRVKGGMFRHFQYSQLDRIDDDLLVILALMFSDKILNYNYAMGMDQRKINEIHVRMFLRSVPEDIKQEIELAFKLS